VFDHRQDRPSSFGAQEKSEEKCRCDLIGEKRSSPDETDPPMVTSKSSSFFLYHLNGDLCRHISMYSDRNLELTHILYRFVQFD